MGATDCPQSSPRFMPGKVGQSVAVGIEKVIEFLHQSDPPCDIVGPVGVVKGTTCSGDGITDILCRCISCLPNGCARPRADDVESLAPFGTAQLAINEKLCVGEKGHHIIPYKEKDQALRAPRSSILWTCRSAGISRIARNASVAEL